MARNWRRHRTFVCNSIYLGRYQADERLPMDLVSHDWRNRDYLCGLQVHLFSAVFRLIDNFVDAINRLLELFNHAVQIPRAQVVSDFQQIESAF